MITVGPATVDDVAGIELCLRSAFEPYRDRYTPGAYADTVLTEQGIRHRLDTMIVLVAVAESGLVVGTIGGSVHGDEGHLRGMAVSPDWQGRGVARPLLESIESRLSAAGCHTASLDTTLPLSRAIAFYERNGYRASGVVTDFFGMPLHEYRKRI
jgi:GNAT superfamily N-acetyltransferase